MKDKSSSSVFDSFRTDSAIKEEEEENVESSVEDEDKYQKDLPEQKQQNNLKREFGLFSAILLIIGSIIGSGIFIAPKGVLKCSGSVAASLLVWTLSGVVALMGALCYAELGTAIPLSGAGYSYFLLVYAPKGRFGPIPAFLYVWMHSLIIRTTTVAILLLTFAEYIVNPIHPSCPTRGVTKKLVAQIALCLITFINCYSVKMATAMNNVFTVAKLLAITIVVSVGTYMLYQGHYQHLISGFEGTRASFSDVPLAFYYGLWAYEGWSDLNFITEEIINPDVNLPRSAMIGIPLVTLCLVLTNISYVTVLSPDDILVSDAVALGFADKVLGPAAFIIPILVAASAFGASSATCLTTSRLPYVAACKAQWPELMSYIQINRLTPTPALIFNAVIVSVMICVGNINTLIDLFSFVAWMFYGGVMVTVIVMRFTEKDLPRPFKVPLVIPIIMSIISAYLVLVPLIINPVVEYFYALIFLLSGLLFYIPFVHYRLRIRIMKRFTHLMQLLLICAPCESVKY